ncbi:hypothetical protein THIOSC15_3140001 [uncultured Thiomicrorhabdus sp.]
MEQMDLQPEECMAFEDSANGIKSSIAANIKTIITINGYTKEDDFSAAELVLTDMGEPGVPFTVLSGASYDHHYLDLALINKVHKELYKA